MVRVWEKEGEKKRKSEKAKHKDKKLLYERHSSDFTTQSLTLSGTAIGKSLSPALAKRTRFSSRPVTLEAIKLRSSLQPIIIWRQV